MNESSAIRRCLQKKHSSVHLLGICGIGMAGLAYLLKKKGVKVSGCDQAPNHLAGWLRKNTGIVYRRHSPAHVKGADWIIKSTAVRDDSPELMAARRKGKPVFRRGEVLAEFISDYDSICVCGTHGKTTTTAMIAQILRAAGRRPKYCLGGEIPGMGVAGWGKGREMVVECDESDGTLARYHPDLAVITNIEFDHAEYFPNVASLKKCFGTLAANTQRKIIYCHDDMESRRMLRGRQNAVSYGFNATADLRLGDFHASANGSAFSLYTGKRVLGKIRLPVPGSHNALNAAAACAIGLEMRIPFTTITRALKSFKPVARRFERIIDTKKLVVISDYAHHPSEIAALMNTVRALPKRRWLAVFQPHRYSRTKALGGFFPAAFKGVSEIILCPVYEASEEPVCGGTSFDLYRHFRKKCAVPTYCAASLRQAWDYLKTRMAAGDGILLVGAGDISKIGEWAKEELGHRQLSPFPLVGRTLPGPPKLPSEGGWVSRSFRRLGHAFGVVNRNACPAFRGASPYPIKFPYLNLKSSVIKFNEPLAGKTTLGVGGTADIFIEAGDENDLVLIRRWAHRNKIPLKILGAGSNLLVSDLGVRGIVVRLKRPAWKNIVLRNSDTIIAGASVSLHELSGWAMCHGLSGAEFLTGIPGTLGGALCMNAGAFGGEIGNMVKWVKVLEKDGACRILRKKQIGFSYRRAKGLAGKIIVAAALKLKISPRGVITRQMRQIQKKRKWMRGMRSAGSIFKNPAGNHAGRLIEELGLKGLTIGGASVSRQHANIITTQKKARASDVLSLIEIIRLYVRMKHGIDLEREIEYWE
jgi:UDP-N-acetylmuramate--L-alanine ligase/UDP-N-acetylenolpyruvoylglucosamine reductase